jgi:predicted phage gp36 major capsid-like protein
MANFIDSAIYDDSALPQISRIVRLEAGDSFKQVVQTGQSVSGRVGETQARTETDTPKLGVLAPESSRTGRLPRGNTRRTSFIQY